MLHGCGRAVIVVDVAVGHARRIEREARIAVAVEKNEAPGGVGALGEGVDSFAGGLRGARGSARNAYALQFRRWGYDVSWLFHVIGSVLVSRFGQRHAISFVDDSTEEPL